MAIYPRVVVNVSTAPPAPIQTPFNSQIAVTDVAQDLVLVPIGKKGRSIDIVNEGPGDVCVKFDATALITNTLIKDGDSVSWPNLEILTKVSFINKVTGELPTLRGVLFSGD